MSRSITVCVDVDVDVSLDRFDTEDLVEELESRRKIAPGSEVGIDAGIPPLNGEEKHPLHEIYYAFKFGLTDRATELARAYVCDQFGVIL